MPNNAQKTIDWSFAISLPPFTQPSKVKDHTGFIGRTKALELERDDPTFPKRIHLPGGLSAWKTIELLEWIENQANKQ